MPRPTHRALLGLSLPLLLFACGQAPAPGPSATNPYAGGKTYPWSSRLEQPVANPYAAGRAYPWKSPTAQSSVGAQGLGQGENFLSDLTWTSARSDWGPIEFDHSNGEQAANDGQALTIGGQTFARGLGVHAESEVRYALNGQCTTFSAVVGVDDEVGDRGSVVFQVWNGSGDRKLYDSGVRRGTDGPLPVSVDVTGLRGVRLVVTNGGDSGDYDHADWADARLSCQSEPPRGSAYLSDLVYASATSGWGPIELDGSNGEQAANDGRAIILGGKPYMRGLGLHADSVVTYNLGDRCTRFTAQVGVDDEVGDRGSVAFQVYGDGEKLYDSGVVTGADEARDVDVPLAGVRELRLVVTNGGDNGDYDHADWAEARVECATQPLPEPGRPGTLDTSFGTNGQIPYGGIDAALGADGSIYFLNAVNGDFALRRYTPDGQTAEVTTDISGQDAPTAVAVDSGGRIVAVGTTDGGANVALVRYKPDLTLDTSFGDGGKVITDLGGVDSSGSTTGNVEQANDIAVRPDGTLVVVGAVRLPLSRYYQGVSSSSYDYAVVQYNPNGTLDQSFGNGGKVFTDLPQGSAGPYVNNNVLNAVTLQPDGKIVAVGYLDCARSSDTITQYNKDGSVDPNFLPNGQISSSDTYCGGYSSSNTVAMASDGRIISGGWTGRFGANAYVDRRNEDGSVDKRKEFQLATGTNVEAYFHSTTAVLVQSDGKILANDLGRIARFNTDLTFDQTFGEQGNGIVPVAARTFLLQPDGKVIAVGDTSTARLWP